METAGKNQASESAIATLSEGSRYEFSDTHLALAETPTCTADGVGEQTDSEFEVGLDYEVPKNLSIVKIEENEGYSRLQYRTDQDVTLITLSNVHAHHACNSKIN